MSLSSAWGLSVGWLKSAGLHQLQEKTDTSDGVWDVPGSPGGDQKAVPSCMRGGERCLHPSPGPDDKEGVTPNSAGPQGPGPKAAPAAH